MSKTQEAMINWAKDHYWDSLESQKDLILKHLNQCPALLKSEPELGEFTKELRASILEQNDGLIAVEKDLIYVPAIVALEACDIIDSLQAEVKVTRQELGAAELEIEKLAKYARHYETCKVHYDGKCTCGLDQALKENCG